MHAVKSTASKFIIVATLLATLFTTGTLVHGQTFSQPLAVSSSTLIASNLIFGGTAIGSTASQPLTLSNTGGSDLAIVGISMAGPGFSANGISSGLILAPGASTVLNVTFSPNANFAASGSVTISTDVGGSAIIWLSGVGVDSPALAPAPTTSTVSSITLQWQPSTSSVSGYNIYRATSPGGESGSSPINGPTLVDGNTFIDRSVVDGTTYYYEVVSVDLNNIPSTDSNEASVLVP